MNVSKSVITAAGPDQRRLPLQRFVDLDGVEKSALQILVEEILAADIEQICIVVRPDDRDAYAEAAGEVAGNLAFVVQEEPRGYGDALLRAADFVGDEPFLHLVSDHLYISGESRRCAQQLVETARAAGAAISAVQPTRESMLPYYGTVGGRLVAGKTDLYEVEDVLEKPTPTEAEQRLIVPGLRASHYLCLFGMHVLTPTVMEILGRQVTAAGDERIVLSPALDELAGRERYLARVLCGARYNIGLKYGTLFAQLALTLAGDDREEILAELVELLARRHQGIAGR
jgi:UTP--glucose-1-phosphate uridylyltransferase